MDVLGRLRMHTTIIYGVGGRKIYGTDAGGESGHKEGVFTVSDADGVASLRNHGAGDEFAAGGGEEAATAEEGDGRQHRATLVGSSDVVVGVVSSVVVDDIGLHNVVRLRDRCVALSDGEKVAEIVRAYPVVVVDEGEIASLCGFNAEVASGGDSSLGVVEEVNVDFELAFGCRGLSRDVMGNGLVVGIARAVENDNDFVGGSIERLLGKGVERLPKVVAGLIGGDNDREGEQGKVRGKR